MTEHVTTYLENILAASNEMDIRVQDITLDQYYLYIDNQSAESQDVSAPGSHIKIRNTDWEKAKELAVDLYATKGAMPQFQTTLVLAPQMPAKESHWKKGRFPVVNSRRRIITLTFLATLAFTLLSVGFLYFFTLFGASLSFEKGLIPVIVIPLIIYPFVFYAIFRQSYQLAMAKAEVEALNRTDPITGLLNKRFFYHQVEMALEVGSRYDFHSSLFLIELDYFKSIKDSYGHLAGDKVLQTASKVIVESLRSTDIVGRFGGEELIAFLPHTTCKQALQVAERIRKILSEQAMNIDGDEIAVTVSMGVTGTEFGIESLDQLLQIADSAMDEAKAGGRNQVQFLSHPSVDHDWNYQTVGQ